MTIRYLTIEEVLALHDYAVERFGGSFGLLDYGKLEASLAAPMQISTPAIMSCISLRWMWQIRFWTKTTLQNG